MILLPQDEREVIRAITRRLQLGLKQYGKLDIRRDKRRFTKEALEEALDLIVYLTIELIRIERRARRQHGPERKAG